MSYKYNCGECSKSSPPSVGSTAFPDEAVRHLARSSCHCQNNAVDVQFNRHWPSCMVGQAQSYLGRTVTVKLGG